MVWNNKCFLYVLRWKQNNKIRILAVEFGHRTAAEGLSDHMHMECWLPSPPTFLHNNHNSGSQILPHRSEQAWGLCQVKRSDYRPPPPELPMQGPPMRPLNTNVCLVTTSNLPLYACSFLIPDFYFEKLKFTENLHISTLLTFLYFSFCIYFYFFPEPYNFFIFSNEHTTKE
jgi:hypothetical protein